MKITSINTFKTLYAKNIQPDESKKALKNNIYSNIVPELNRYQTNPLIDYNYGHLLVNKKNNVSFKGIEKIGTLIPSVIKNLPFEERLASLYEIIGSSDVIVAAKNKKTAQTLLNKASGVFDDVIKRIFFLPEENIPEAIAIVRTDLAPGLINLGENPILITNLEKKNYLVGPKSSIWLQEDAKVHIGENLGMDILKFPDNTFQFSIKEKSSENLSMLRPQFAIPINKTDDVKKSIDNINKKTFKDLFTDESAAKTFGLADVGGMKDIIKELKRNILYPIKRPDLYANRNLNHGIILYGPPGTGKTFVAKALANDAGAAYFEVNAGSLRGGLVGQTESNWRKLFQDAIDNQPSIILVDECDAVFKQRSSLQPYAADELNQILSLLSDLEKNNEQVFVISTTNKIEMLDDAVVRGGRLGKQLEIKAPSLEDIKDILEKQLKNFNIDKNFDKNKFAKKLFDKGLNGSDLKCINDNAYDMAFERLNIFEKIEQDLIKEEDIKNIILTEEDFYKGLDKYISQNIKASGGTKRRPVGFIQPETSEQRHVIVKKEKPEERFAAMG